MNAHDDRRRNPRARKVHKVAPVARAIRAALAASATMLALSGTALAQDACVASTARSAQACADARATVHADASLSVMPVDLTRVAGDQVPASAIGDDAWASHTAIDAGSIATLGAGNGLVIGSYSGGVAYADLTQLDIVDVISADETMVGADATAIGALVNGGEGIGLLINGGQITATASTDTGTAYAVGAAVYADVATVINDTTIVVDARADTGAAKAVGTSAYGMNTGAYNYGDITVGATAIGTGGTAGAMGLYSIGLVSAISENQGDIDVSADGDARATAVGIYNTAGAYGSTILNSGTIGVHATSHADYSFAGAAGLQGTSINGFGVVDIHNSGDILATADATGDRSVGVTYGVLGISGGGDIQVTNDGSIHADTTVDSGFGLINAFGAYAYSYGGEISIVNNGDLAASGHGAGYTQTYVFGIYSFAGASDASATSDVRNNGHISAIGSADMGVSYATGVRQLGWGASTTNAAGASIDAISENEHAGYATAIGVWNMGFYQSAITNDGTISADAHATGSFFYSAVNAGALGLYANSGPSGNASVVNNGDVSAVAKGENSADHYHSGAGATGIQMYGDRADLQNAGDVHASAWVNTGIAGSYGASAKGKYSTNVVSSGDITAYAYAGTLATDVRSAAHAVAEGLHVFGTRYATVTNSGGISATAIAADAYGNASSHTQSYAIGVNEQASRTATLTNSGDISAYARGDLGNADAYGVHMLGKRAGVVTNDGDISAEAVANGGYAWAVGVYDFSRENATSGVSTLVNSGSIEGQGRADGGMANAYGAVLIGQSGVNADNSGAITATAAGGVATAEGLLGRTLTGATSVYNTGTVGAVATSTAGDAKAEGAVAFGTTVTTLITDGVVYADANATGGNAVAYGAYVKGGIDGGIGLLINGGDVDATASVDGGLAYAVGAVVYADVSSVFNDDDVGATAHAINGDAMALGLQTYSFNSGAYNYGDLIATAVSDNGNAGAQGIRSYGYFSSIADNIGDIAVSVQSTADATATGVYSMAIFSGAYATNAGTIAVGVEGESAIGNGVLNADLYVGNATVTNSGDIGVTAHGFSKAFAVGAYNFAYLYDAVLTNSGDIVASARAEGNPAAVQRVDAIGAQTVNVYGQGWGDASLVNDGMIAALGWVEYGTGNAWGAIVQAGPYATASLENNSTLYANMHAELGVAGAYGAVLQTYGKADVVNHGDIVALSSVTDPAASLSFIQYADATGITATGYSTGAYVANDGTIHAEAIAGGGLVHATGVSEIGNVASLTNAGDIEGLASTTNWGGAFAYGAAIHGSHEASIVNDGTITARGDAHDDASGHYGASRATGVYAEASRYGNITVVNNGDINAIATAENGQRFFSAGAMAKGIDTYGKYDVLVENHGDINAVAISDIGAVAAYGVIADSKYAGHAWNAAGAVITATAASSTLPGDYAGGRAVAVGMETMNSDVALAENDGTIIAHASVQTAAADQPGEAMAFGVHNYFAVDSGTVVNRGDIEAVAVAAHDYASAYGTFINAGDVSSTINAGSILAAAQSDQGNAWAVGSYNFAYHRTYNGCDAYGCHYTVDGGTASVDNQGDIVAQAIADGGIANAYGTVTIAVLDTGITNAGHITSIANGDQATASGALTNTLSGGSAATNTGTIAASATGTTSADATGLALQATTSVTIDNGGSIAAFAHGTDVANAIAAKLTNTSGLTVDNTGSLVAGAYGADANATALWLDAAGANNVTNSGTIAAFGDGARVAIASHADSSTSIANTGSIIGAINLGDLAGSLDNAAGANWLAVGTSNFGGGDDTIANAGLIVMQDATIDLGGYVTGNAFSNSGSIFASGHNTIAMGGAFAARNDGTISFLDGATDDVLTIDGDFAGQGRLLLDVSGARNASDLLYVTGNVADATVQTLDIDVLDLPTAPVARLPMVYVDGDSSAKQFVLGKVRTRQNDFTTLDVKLNAQINPATAARDMFYLGVDVTGLNDQGAIATALSPGVARMIDAQIGTFRQRMGVVPRDSGKIGLAPFVRGFADSGDVDPDHGQNFGTGGDYGFSQSNQGWEVGLDSRPGSEFAFGLLVSKSKGNQRLDNGLGRNDMTGTGFGLYLTYLGNDGAYIDGSMRWTGVEARMHSLTAFQKTHGSANTTNIEAGLAPWRVGGIGIQPQVQYTFTRIADFEGMQGGSAEFVELGGDSQRGRLGVLYSKDIETNGFLLQPYGSINAVHEFNGEYRYSINDNALFGATSLGGTSAMVELGLGARKDKWSLTGGFNWTDGAALDGLFGGQVVVRYSW